MKTNRILAFLIVALSVLTGLPTAFASKAVANRAYVQSGPDGVFYARCIPKDNTGSAGITDIYRVKSDGDELVDHYDWYSAHSVVLGWSPIAGKVAVMVRHRDAPTTPDKHVEFTLHLGGKLLKSWTTADLVRLGAAVGPNQTDGGKRAEFQVVGCEQIEIPGANQYAFTLRLSTGRLLFFNILTGDEYVPLGRDLDFKKDTAVVTPKPDAIDQLVAKLSVTHGLWRNGIFRNLKMPESASPEEIVEQVFKFTGFDKGRVKDFKILQSRTVQIGGEAYTAAEVQTDLGKKVVLFTAGGSWNRVYDADEPAKPNRNGASGKPPQAEESPLKSSQLPADGSPETIAAAAKMGAATAAADIKAGVFRILYSGIQLSVQADEATGYRLQHIGDSCIVGSAFKAEKDAYNQAMRDWQAKNPLNAPPFKTGIRNVEPPVGSLGYKIGSYLTIEGVREEEGKVGISTLRVDTINGHKLEQSVPIWMYGVELPEKERCIFKGYETGQWIGVSEEVLRATGKPAPQAGWQFHFGFSPTSVEQPKNLEIKRQHLTK